MCNRLKKTFYTFVFLFFSLALDFSSEAKCNIYEINVYKGSRVSPITTTKDGGSNSFKTPKLGIHVTRCNLGEALIKSSIVDIGKSYSPYGLWGYTYYVMANSDEDVCRHECAYAYKCPSEEKKAISPDPNNPVCGGSGNSEQSANCDPQLSSITIQMCKYMQDNYGVRKMVGICGYKSDDTGLTMALEQLFAGIIEAAFLPALAMSDLLENGGQFSLAPPSGTSLIGCYPVPIAALPPPFCEGGNLQYSNLKVLRICAERETPVRTLSGSVEECVKPLDGTRSTFMRPCVRVTYDNPSPANTIARYADSNYQDYYSQGGEELLYEILVKSKDGNNEAYEQAGDTVKVRYTDVYDESNSYSQLKLYGINDANYIDICGEIDTQGNINKISYSGSSSSSSCKDSTGKSINASSSILVDGYTNCRDLNLTLQCQDDGSCSTPQEKFNNTQICVHEQRGSRDIVQQCVDRPEMDKPTVTFCDDNLNDKASACMKVTTENAFNTNADYTFEGSMTQCIDTPQTLQPNLNIQLCTLNSQTDNAFGFQAILTNRCYVSMRLSIQESSKFTAKNMCYKNNTSCSVPSNKQGCSNCALDEYCFTQYSNSNSPGQVTGVERLCLYGYADRYKSLAPAWCTDDSNNACNRICATAQFVDDTGKYIPNGLVDISNRTNPTPSASTPLRDSCPYDSSKLLPNSPEAYRVRNPVEEELCVDVYTVKFNKECQGGQSQTESSSEMCKDIKSFCAIMKIPQNLKACQTAFDQMCKVTTTFPIELCNNVKSYCSSTKNSSNHYDNFDECQEAFNYCLTNPKSTNQRSLGSNIKYTCSDLSQIVSTS